MPIEFRFDEMAEEVRWFRQAAARFLSGNAGDVLDRFERRLLAIRDEASSRISRWEISHDTPVCTEVSEGGYEPGGGGKRHVYASLTSVWEIRPLPRVRKLPPRFLVAGIASVRVEFFEHAEEGDPTSLGSWRMELGAKDAPGCFFHVQILGDEEQSPFPHSVPVPRLPSILFTPTAVLEFVLGELFQDAWAGEVRRASDALRTWARIQRQRLSTLLRWHVQQVESAVTSPWGVLKAALPQPGLFLS